MIIKQNAAPRGAAFLSLPQRQGCAAGYRQNRCFDTIFSFASFLASGRQREAQGTVLVSHVGSFEEELEAIDAPPVLFGRAKPKMAAFAQIPR